MVLGECCARLSARVGRRATHNNPGCIVRYHYAVVAVMLYNVPVVRRHHPRAGPVSHGRLRRSHHRVVPVG